MNGIVGLFSVLGLGCVLHGFAPNAIDSPVGVAIVEPDALVMHSDSRCPNEVTRHLVALLISGYAMTDGGVHYLPMYQVFGRKDL